MNKLNKSIHTFVDNIIQLISSEHHIPVEDLKRTISPIFQKEEPFEKCNGLVSTKNNQVCQYKVVPGTSYCRRHTPTELTNAPTIAKSQCTATNNNGSQCIRNAKPGETICGIHMSKAVYSKRKIVNEDQQIPCIYYEDTNDDTVFCLKNTLNTDTWFCKKHAHLQTMYERVYGANNVKQYILSSTKTISIVDNFIKDNCGDII